MNRKGLLISLAGGGLLVSLALSGTVDAVKTNPASTTGGTIDGTPFRAVDPDHDDTALLRRELKRIGAQVPESLAVMESSGKTHPIFLGKVVVPGKTLPVAAPEIAQGLSTDHTLRMSGAGGSVELVFGKMGHEGMAIASRMEAHGWKPLPAGGNARSPRMLQQVRGKEATVVFLDEKDRTFLLFRRLGR